LVTALSHCKVAVIVLTKKWLRSDWCKAELGLANLRNKTTLVILPPVASVDDRATAEDVPVRIAGVHIDFPTVQGS